MQQKVLQKTYTLQFHHLTVTIVPIVHDVLIAFETQDSFHDAAIVVDLGAKGAESMVAMFALSHARVAGPFIAVSTARQIRRDDTIARGSYMLAVMVVKDVCLQFRRIGRLLLGGGSKVGQEGMASRRGCHEAVGGCMARMRVGTCGSGNAAILSVNILGGTDVTTRPPIRLIDVHLEVDAVDPHFLWERSHVFVDRRRRHFLGSAMPCPFRGRQPFMPLEVMASHAACSVAL
mmetsp:Transcript_43753/g.93038  ORF Transcript_43753/g.93038 Transcript_43753/m.93038 type:complete len:233 (+) Transcript_43753:120-818(+)